MNIDFSTADQYPTWMNQEAIDTLSRGYFLPGETPRTMWERVTKAAAKTLNYAEIETDLFEMFWKGFVGGSTPVLSNMGSNRGLPISCLETGTRIHTPDGYKEIQDLVPGDLVLTHLGNWKRVVNVWSRQTTGDLYYLSVSNRWSYGLNITGNHPVLTNQGWVKVEDLDPNTHQICVEPITDVFRKRSKRKTFDFKIGSQRYNAGRSQLVNSGGFKVKEVPNVYLNNEVAWWLGLWFAEGHTSDNGTIGISMGWDEEHHLDEWLRIAEKYFGLKGTKNIYLNPRGHQHAQARIHNKYLSQFFDKEFGKGCKNKTIPAWFFEQPDDTLRSFADGFIIGDGSVGEGIKSIDSPTVSVGIANERLSYQLWYLFTLLGRFPSLGRNIAPYHKLNNNGEDLNYSDHGCFWTYLPKKVRSGRGLSRSFTVKKQERETTVWDIEVEDDHSFIAQGVVVHNCYSTHISDSIHSIYSHLKEVAALSKHGGGVGVYLGDIRSSGSHITGGGKSTGVVPWARQYDYASQVVSQGGVRRGSFALYLPIDHPDLMELLRAKDHSQGDPRNFIDSQIAVTIEDKWVEEMIAGDREKQKLFGEVLKIRLVSGSPYLIFIDNANNQRPSSFKKRNLEIFTSNLCFTADTLVAVADGRGAVPIIDLVDTQFTVHSAASVGGAWSPEVKLARAFKTGTKQVVVVELEDGSKFRCTADHRLALRDTSWVEAKDSVGKVIESIHMAPGLISGGLEVVSLTEEGIEDVYCLNVDDNHNFYIITNRGDEIWSGVLVSNCSEIFLPTDENHTFVCVLSSLNLARWDEWKDWKGPNTGKTVPELMVYFLDAVVDEFIAKADRLPSMGRAVRFARKSRSLGVGTMGLHALYQKHSLPFSSVEARALNVEVHRFIDEMTLKASKDMAITYGEPEWCKGDGVRHATRIAIAPTKSNSVICGAVSQGIEPIEFNYFVAKQAKGSFVRKNPYLEAHLRQTGYDLPEVWQSILDARGSVQHLEFLSPHTREVFKTAREIDQFEIIKQAVDRQPYVCQGQSVNLFVDPESTPEYLMKLHLAAWKNKLKSLYYLKSSSLLVKKAPPKLKLSVNKIARIYSKPGCPYCDRAKEELLQMGYKIDEAHPKDWSDGKFPYKTVPQIWLDGNHVGGYDALMTLKQLESNWPTHTEPVYEECEACQG